MITYRIRVVADRCIDVVLDKRDDDLACQIALDEAVLEHAEACIECVTETEQASHTTLSGRPDFSIGVEIADDEDRHVAIGIPEQLCTDCDATCDPVCLTCPTCGSYSLRSL